MHGRLGIPALAALSFSACAEDATEMFVPAPSILGDVTSMIYVIDNGRRHQIIATEGSGPVRSQFDPTEAPVSIEVLGFDFSLEELGLEPGPVASLAQGSGVSVVDLDPVVARLTLSEGSAAVWRFGVPSARASDIRVRGPCPSWEVTTLEDFPGRRLAIARDSEILLLAQDGITSLRFEDDELVETTTRAIDLPLEPYALAMSSDSGGWMSASGVHVGVFTLEPFMFEPHFRVPDYPDVIEEETGLPRSTVVLGLAPLDTADGVLVATGGGVIGRYDDEAGFERLGVAPVSGAAARLGSIQIDGYGRHLIALSGTQVYFSYEGGALREHSILEAGPTGVGIVGHTTTHGTLIFGRDTGTVLRQVAPDEWEEIVAASVDFEPVDVADFRDGFVVNGQRGELAFYSDRTGLCPLPQSSNLTADGRGGFAVLGNSIARVMRIDEMGMHRAWLFQASR